MSIIPKSNTAQYNPNLWAKGSKSIGGCSSNMRGSSSSCDKSYVAIFYPSSLDHLLIRASVESLLEKNNLNLWMMSSSHDLEKQYKLMPRRNPSELTKDFIDLLPTGPIHHTGMKAICTSSVGAALGPFIFLFLNTKEVWRFDLHKPHSTGFHKCADMAVSIYDTLPVQIGDFFYVLGFEGGKHLVVQKYDIENDIWTLFKDNIITKFNHTDKYTLSMNTVPHVLINRKLHVSFGYNSFAFDTEKDMWEHSNLFQTFWSGYNNPLNFYGEHVWAMYDSDLKSPPNQPFGFYRRGIVWDGDILLGVHYSKKCQLVAFQLHDNKAVKSQSFTFTDDEFHMAYLLDLGQGYFGLLHVVMNPDCFQKATCYDEMETCYDMELVTIFVSKPKQPQDGCFLECQIVRKDCVAHNLCDSVHAAYKAFCV